MCFIFHNWGKWETIKKCKLVREDNDSVVAQSLYQERECKDCGKKDISIETRYY